MAAARKPGPLLRGSCQGWPQLPDGLSKTGRSSSGLIQTGRTGPGTSVLRSNAWRASHSRPGSMATRKSDCPAA